MLATLALAVAPGGLTADQGTDLVDALTTAAAIHSEVAAAVAPMAVAASRMAYGVAPASGTYVGPGPRWVVVSDVGMADRAPEAWDRQDPADSLYRAARSAMNRSEYEEAAELFHRIWNEHPRSTYAPDAPYWEAFNRYRTGETRELEGALEVLEAQRERYASAPTRANGDAAALRARVRGQLASRGDEEAAREMVAVARAAAGEAIGPAMMAATEAMEAMDVGAITAEALEGARVGLEAARYSLAGAMGGGLGEVPEGCQDEVEVQSAALNALMHMDEDRAMPVLAQVMERRDECAAPLRRRAVFIIADKGGAEAVDLLLEAARNDPDREVRRQAVFWLSEADDPRAVEALVDMVARSDDEALRERAVFALGQSDSPRARAALRRVAGDTDAPVDLRRRAVFWIGENGGADDVRFIQGLFPTGDAALDERILFAVGEAGGAGSGDWLLRVAADADVDPTLRKRAVFWAAEAGAPADALGALYESTRAPDMKERILFALSESPEDAAMDHLIRIAREEQDHDLRRRAIFWLGNSSDPRAADALMDLLARPRQ